MGRSGEVSKRGGIRAVRNIEQWMSAKKQIKSIRWETVGECRARRGELKKEKRRKGKAEQGEGRKRRGEDTHTSIHLNSSPWFIPFTTFSFLTAHFTIFSFFPLQVNAVCMTEPWRSSSKGLRDWWFSNGRSEGRKVHQSCSEERRQNHVRSCLEWGNLVMLLSLRGSNWRTLADVVKRKKRRYS